MLTALIEAWHRDNGRLFGRKRRSRQREIYNALLAVGGEATTGTLLAICDDIEPHVAVFDHADLRADSCLSVTGKGNHLRLASLRRRLAERSAK